METIAEIIGKRVRAQRKNIGLSQEQLAELCDLHPTYIGQLERGEKNASLETIMRVCKGLNVAPSELFSNVSAGSEKTTADVIYDLVMDMPESKQKIILNIIRDINSIT